MIRGPFKSCLSRIFHANFQKITNSTNHLFTRLFDVGIVSVHADHVASHLGKAQGITNLLRGLPHHCTRRSVPLPQSVLLQHGVAQERVLRGSRDQEVRDVIFDVATRAKQHLDKVEALGVVELYRM